MMATFKGFTVLCYLKRPEEVEGLLKKPGCNVVSLNSFEELLDTLRVCIGMCKSGRRTAT